jgi:hypothetical protein
MHFFTLDVLAAPASGLLFLSTALVSQSAWASFLHLSMERGFGGAGERLAVLVDRLGGAGVRECSGGDGCQCGGQGDDFEFHKRLQCLLFAPGFPTLSLASDSLAYRCDLKELAISDVQAKLK